MEKPRVALLRKSLGQMLIEANLITPEQLQSALKTQQGQERKLGQIFVEQGVLTPRDLATVLSIQLNVPFIDLDLKTHVIQPRALRMIPEETARKYNLIPMDIVADALVVVMADPGDIRAVEDLQAQSRMRVEPALGIPSDIQEAINLNYRAGNEIEKRVSQFPSPMERQGTQSTGIAAETPVVQTMNLLISQAVKDRASDIHIEPQEDRLRIRYRIDGILRETFSLPLSAHGPLVSRVKILAEMNIAEQRRPQDGQFSVKAGGRDIDIRVATTETAHGERMTLRILDRTLALFTLSELGFTAEALKKYRQMLKSSFGMILVGGPTGSGKTTTLYASVNQLDRNERNIMTIEDPIEYHFNDINQIQVNPKAGITFTGGLRAILRHDPDVILVGEIRDSDTARTAVQAALTGHLVLSSIHANDTVTALFRLMDLGVEPYLISSTLVGIVAQRMVRRICPHCQVLAQPTREEWVAYFEEMADERATFRRGTGCNFCANTGYSGRTGLFEILTMSEEIRRMVSSRASAGEVRAQALREGLVTMKRDGMLKVKAGHTTSNEVLRQVFSLG